MHIVYLTVDFIENNGPTTGLPKYLYRVAKALTEWGHKVSIITCSNRTVSYEFYGIHVCRVRRPAIRQYGDQQKDAITGGLRDGFIVNQKLHELYQKEKIDIVQYTSLNGLAYYHDIPVPAVTRLSSYALMVAMEGQEEAQKGRAMLEREAAEKSDAVFAPAGVVAERLSRDIGKRIDVIETPFVMEENEEDDRLYHDYFADREYFLFYGTLIAYKGLLVIADAVYEILDKYRDIYIGIIGDGDRKLLENVKQKAGEHVDRIIYHPAVGFSQLKPVIQNARAIMLPSLTENFSNACVESMALGQIVIGTDGASFEQLIDDGRSGFLCRIGDAKTLAEAVDKVMALSDEQRALMQKEATMRADLLKPEKVVKQLLDYYESVIKSYAEKNER